MMIVTALLCGLIPAVFGRPITGVGLSGRSPVESPVASTAETALQFLLRNDQEMCLLKLVCGAGANVSRYGVYADSIANSLGYQYQPFDFSVVRRPNLAEKLEIVGRDATNDREEEFNAKPSDGSIFIRAPTFASKHDFTWVVKVTPSKPVYVNKPVKVWRPAPFQWPIVKPFPAIKTVAIPTIPILQDVTRVQKPTLSITKEVQKMVQHLPTSVLKVFPFDNLPASSFKDQSKATAPNVWFLTSATNGLLTSDDLRSGNESLSISGNSTVLKVTKETFVDDDLRADDDIVLMNKDSTEGVPAEDFSVAPDVSEGEGGNQLSKDNEDSGETITSDNVTEATNMTHPSIIVWEEFNTSVAISRSDAEVEDIVEPQERSGLPASYIFNRAFALGLRSGSEACSKTFGECPMNVDRIVRFGSNLFMSPASTINQS